MRTHYTAIPAPGDLPRARPGVTVVIDVMRAFTTAAWAFKRGARSIVLTDSDDEALDLKARNPDWLTLRDGPPAPGFDFVNSPAMLSTSDLVDRTLVQRTTYGTAGALAFADAPLLLCASFVVASATAKRLRVARAEGAEEVTFVVTGEEGRAEEDRACAEYIAGLVETRNTDPAPYLRRAHASGSTARLAEDVRLGHAGAHPEDVDMCLEADRFRFIMVARRTEDGLLALHPAMPLPPMY